MRKKGDPITLVVFEEKEMTRQGMMHWTSRLRAKVRKKTFHFVETMRIDPREIDTPEKIKALCMERWGRGIWDIRGMSHKKNKYRVSPCRLAKVTVTGTEYKQVAHIDYSNSRGVIRLPRMWFWRG